MDFASDRPTRALQNHAADGRTCEMRIGFIDYSSVDTAGGTSRWLSEVSRRLVRNHDVMIATTASSHRYLGARSALISDGVEVVEVEPIRPSSLPHLRDCLRLFRALEDLDVLYFIWTTGGLELIPAAERMLSAVPIVIGHHQIVRPDESMRHTDIARSLYYKLFGFRSSRLIRLFKYHHVQTQEFADNLRTTYPGKYFMIPPGVDTHRFQPGQKGQVFTVLFLGRLDVQKGADLLPALFAELSKRLPRFRLQIGGVGPLQPLVARLGQHENVDVLGYIPESDLPSVISSAHVMIMPSRYEPFGVVALEALACGTPVVAFNVQGPRVVIDSTKIGAIVDTPSQMVSAIVERSAVLTDPIGMELTQKACRLRAIDFEWDRVVPRLEQMFRSIAPQSAGKAADSNRVT